MGNYGQVKISMWHGQKWREYSHPSNSNQPQSNLFIPLYICLLRPNIKYLSGWMPSYKNCTSSWKVNSEITVETRKEKVVLLVTGRKVICAHVYHHHGGYLIIIIISVVPSSSSPLKTFLLLPSFVFHSQSVPKTSKRDSIVEWALYNFFSATSKRWG